MPFPGSDDGNIQPGVGRYATFPIHAAGPLVPGFPPGSSELGLVIHETAERVLRCGSIQRPFPAAARIGIVVRVNSAVAKMDVPCRQPNFCERKSAETATAPMPAARASPIAAGPKATVG